MRIQFNEISPAGSTFSIDSIAQFRDQDIVSFQKGVKSYFLLRRRGKNKVEMAGNLTAIPLIKCDRCLTSYSYPIQTDYHIVFEHGSDTWKLKEIECSSSDMETVILDEPEIDIDDILRQQVLLQLPGKKICTADCRGLCPYCGQALNDAGCQCKAEEQLTPLAAALMKITKKN